MLLQDIRTQPNQVQNRDYVQEINDYVEHLYGDIPISPCPFTKKEIEELDSHNELLVYLPAKMSMKQLCQQFGIKANVDFEHETMIKNTMVSEDQWFITSASKTPELMYKTGVAAKRMYEDEGLHGMDFRRYLAFAATFKYKFGVLPDQTYWTFLLSGSYDRSGISIVGFDSRNVLNHHGWMKNFKAKFLGSRYIVIAPRVEIVPETVDLTRAYREKRGTAGKEADME
ncbi:hypothetical protein VB713_23120 [Anabaena cylindrica UHCC 0172]|uniref:hypothetical protein n=1 Tax=Anabaena cylindrica TaxID=1165 RepID=UPI002B22090F|nr:hypothetical protein [Anabaena cylindrica]MEA5553834.1 hypothetical protein [Anabaena cylindrica UHCC 0172]